MLRRAVARWPKRSAQCCDQRRGGCTFALVLSGEGGTLPGRSSGPTGGTSFLRFCCTIYALCVVNILRRAGMPARRARHGQQR